MAGSNKPAKQESQHPQKGTGSSGFTLVQDEGIELNPMAGKLLMATATHSRSGPLPASTEFAGYEQTLPGAADRILAMAEMEQAARLQENQTRLRLDEKIITGYKWRTGFAQFASLALVIFVFCVSYNLCMNNHEKAGIAFGTTTVIAILGAFLTNKLTQSKDAKDVEQQ